MNRKRWTRAWCSWRFSPPSASGSAQRSSDYSDNSRNSNSFSISNSSNLIRSCRPHARPARRVDNRRLYLRHRPHLHLLLLANDANRLSHHHLHHQVRNTVQLARVHLIVMPPTRARKVERRLFGRVCRLDLTVMKRMVLVKRTAMRQKMR